MTVRMVPTRAFTDRVCRPERGSIEMIEHRNGDWHYRIGIWLGRYFPGESYGGSAMVKVVDWPAHGSQSAATLMTLMWGHQLQRRWPHAFTDRKLAQLAREFCEDAQRGAVGFQ